MMRFADAASAQALGVTDEFGSRAGACQPGSARGPEAGSSSNHDTGHWAVLAATGLPAKDAPRERAQAAQPHLPLALSRLGLLVLLVVVVVPLRASPTPAQLHVQMALILSDSL